MSTLLLCRTSAALPSAAQLDRVRVLAPDMRVATATTDAEIEALLPEAEIIGGVLPPAMIERAPKLRWLQYWAASVDWLMRYPAAVQRDFLLTNASGAHRIHLNEHVFACMLAFARRLPEVVEAQRLGTWRRPALDQISELAGKTLLLVGVGAIGGRTAELGKAFGMRVVGVRRNAGEAVPGVEAMHPPERLRELLPQADHIVVSLPRTHATMDMIGEAELRVMKPGAFLMNVGRSGPVNEAALLAALRENRLYAALDVFDEEPLPSSSPLWKAPNLLITPHYAGMSPNYGERVFEIFFDNLKRFRDGQPLRNLVDKRAGY